jgi:LysM repeat protein
MKQSKLPIVVLVISLVILTMPVRVYAQSVQKLESLTNINKLLGITKPIPQPPFKPITIKPTDTLEYSVIPPSITPEPPKPQEYIVVAGDTLTKIAESQNTTIQSLWTKNTQLANQNELKVGDKLIIPLSTEVLDPRPFITPPLPIQAPKSALNGVKRASTITTSGNTYTTGYCTWYVKNLRPDLPNGLGNANTWYSRANALGLAVGSTPQVGAVGTTTRGSDGHVVYVEAVNGQTITISEMNYQGWNIASSRTANANEFVYIY